MSAEIKLEFQQLLSLFEETWAGRDALRTLCEREIGRAADWESLLESSQLRAHELFGPALSDIRNGVPVATILAKLLDRLETASGHLVKV